MVERSAKALRPLPAALATFIRRLERILDGAMSSFQEQVLVADFGS